MTGLLDPKSPEYLSRWFLQHGFIVDQGHGPVNRVDLSFFLTILSGVGYKYEVRIELGNKRVHLYRGGRVDAGYGRGVHQIVVRPGQWYGTSGNPTYPVFAGQPLQSHTCVRTDAYDTSVCTRRLNLHLRLHRDKTCPGLM